MSNCRVISRGKSAQHTKPTMVPTYSFRKFMIAISFLANACRTLALMTIPKPRVESITEGGKGTGYFPVENLKRRVLEALDAADTRGTAGRLCVNRGSGRATVFRKPQDYEAFLDLLAEAKRRHRVKLFGFCLMPLTFTSLSSRITKPH
jgi:hypothetical protein